METGKEQLNHHLAHRLLTVCLVAIVLILSACNSSAAPLPATTMTPPETTTPLVTTTSPPTTTTMPPPTTTTTLPPTTATTAPPTTTTTPLPTQAFNEVFIFDYNFFPDPITVPVGTTVTWTNVGLEFHKVTTYYELFLFNVGLRPGESFSYTFNEPGTYGYFCTPHYMGFEEMGNVIVE